MSGAIAAALFCLLIPAFDIAKALKRIAVALERATGADQ